MPCNDCRYSCSFFKISPQEKVYHQLISTNGQSEYHHYAALSVMPALSEISWEIIFSTDTPSLPGYDHFVATNLQKETRKPTFSCTDNAATLAHALFIPHT